MVDEVHQLTRAFSGLGGLGVDEPTMVSALARWRKQPEKRSAFRKSFTGFFKGHGEIDRCEEEYLLHLAAEFERFKNLMVLWAMHPWERDARLAHHVLHQAHPAAIVVEVACTRSADELLGARRAYQALFHHSLEEDVAYRARDKPYCNLLVGLVSAYRYEGPRVNEEVARAEAKALGAAVKSAGGVAGKLLENDEVVRILSTRSKPHLVETFKYYKEMHGKHIEEDLGKEETLHETVLCLAAPAKYFSQVIEEALRDGADNHGKDALSRVAVTRSDVDMDEIRAAYHEQFGAKLEDAIAAKAHGHYRDALLSLVGAGGK
ncbi:annexin D4-like [Phragmites australis]|uniref:annexin D4-like n=1 Tax=Phragmites australis TaxID=29695 RepID=UPI002D79E43D|nr:annexin D4-like [Phragmites australis]